MQTSYFMSKVIIYFNKVNPTNRQLFKTICGILGITSLAQINTYSVFRSVIGEDLYFHLQCT